MNYVIFQKRKSKHFIFCEKSKCQKNQKALNMIFKISVYFCYLPVVWAYDARVSFLLAYPPQIQWGASVWACVIDASNLSSFLFTPQNHLLTTHLHLDWCIILYLFRQSSSIPDVLQIPFTSTELLGTLCMLSSMGVLLVIRFLGRRRFPRKDGSHTRGASYTAGSSRSRGN